MDPNQLSVSLHELSGKLGDLVERLARLEIKLEQQAKLEGDIKGLQEKTALLSERIAVMQQRVGGAIAIVGVAVPVVLRLLHL
jgi:hypothetical protein